METDISLTVSNEPGVLVHVDSVSDVSTADLDFPDDTRHGHMRSRSVNLHEGFARDTIASSMKHSVSDHAVGHQFIDKRNFLTPNEIRLVKQRELERIYTYGQDVTKSPVGSRKSHSATIPRSPGGGEPARRPHNSHTDPSPERAQNETFSRTGYTETSSGQRDTHAGREVHAKSSPTERNLPGSKEGNHHGSTECHHHGSTQGNHHGSTECHHHGSTQGNHHGSVPGNHHKSTQDNNHGSTQGNHHGSTGHLGHHDHRDTQHGQHCHSGSTGRSDQRDLATKHNAHTDRSGHTSTRATQGNQESADNLDESKMETDRDSGIESTETPNSKPGKNHSMDTSAVQISTKKSENAVSTHKEDRLTVNERNRETHRNTRSNSLNKHDKNPYLDRNPFHGVSRNKDNSDSEVEHSTMPSPAIRARNRDRSPNRQTNNTKPQRGHGINNNNNNNNLNSNNNSGKPSLNRGDSGRRKHNNSSSTRRRQKVNEDQTANALDTATDEVDTEIEAVSNEDKLETFLRDCLTECSRQRLRAIHMSMRRLGNVEARITQKDLHQAFQENSVKLSNRVFQLMTETFVDHLGIDYERLHRVMVRAQSRTRRDSVVAMQARNDLEMKTNTSREKKDADFLRRLEEQLILDQTFFDIEELHKYCQSRDANKTGKISKEDLFRSCSDVQIPLYGALLKNMANHCDTDNNGGVSWPEFLNFLEKSQKMAISKHPDMAELPAKAKEKQMASPLDLMDPDKKSRIVKTLLKKASESRVNIAAANTALSQQEDNMPGDDSAQQTNEDPKPSPPDINNDNAITGTANRQPSESKRKDELDLVTPIIEIDQASDIIPDDSDPSNQSDDIQMKAYGGPADPSVVRINVKGKDVTLRKPTGYCMDNASVDLPSERLKLDWVYGYRGNDCRSNIHVLTNGEVVYFMANVVILYNKDAHSQRHYREHTEMIKSLAVHSNGVTVASGQVDSKTDSETKAHIRVWRSDTLHTLHVLGVGTFERSVMCMAFAKTASTSKNLSEGEDTNGVKLEDQLIAIDNSQEKAISLWDTAGGKPLGKGSVGTDVICEVSFNPKYPAIFVTIGKEHIAWWKAYPESGAIQLLHLPEYESYLKAKFVICLTHNHHGDLVTGDSNGTIYVWGDGASKITNYIKHGHDGPVFSVMFYKTILLSGGRDSIIRTWQWGKNMEPLQTIEIPKNEGGVRYIQLYKDILLIGTTMNSMLSADIPGQGTSPLEGIKLNDIPLTQGHFGDLRGLSVIADVGYPGDFITTGLDGIICMFSAEKREPVWKLVMKSTMFEAVDSSRVGNLLVFGTKDGHLFILNVLEDHSFQEAFKQKVVKDKITCVKLSPDCSCVAIGCGDKLIYIYKLKTKDGGAKTWELHGKCKGHGGSITAIDWSTEKNEENYFLRSSSSVPEQLFWNTKTLDKVENVDDIQHICWASNICTLDLSNVGLWTSKQGRESDIQTVDVNPSKSAVAMGDSHGYISLFKYPSCRQGAFSHTYRAHLSVHNLRFVCDGKYLITEGGGDSCVMQWKVV